MKYRRARLKGGAYFFTIVTHRRRTIFRVPRNVSLLRDAVRIVMKRHPFRIDAFVLLPDHLHCLWRSPDGDSDFSTRWRLIKSHFSRACPDRYKRTPFSSRAKKGEQAIWQRRFWEHHIRDEDDFVKHVEYIHYNPVKHGLVKAPKDWPYSSFHRYVRNGLYEGTWGKDLKMTFDDGVGNE